MYAFIGLLAIMCASLGIFTGWGVPSSKVVLPDHVKQAIVRLHSAPDKGAPETSRFFCSGFMISQTRLITAAHCVDPADTVIIKDYKNENILGIAMPIKHNQRGDTAVLEMVTPSISTKATLKIMQGGAEVQEQFDKSEIVACGFPWGGDLTCTRVKDPSRIDFSVKAFGFLYPGMSGGPVISIDADSAIALNTAVMGEYIILSPLVGILSGL